MKPFASDQAVASAASAALKAARVSRRLPAGLEVELLLAPRPGDLATTIAHVTACPFPVVTRESRARFDKMLSGQAGYAATIREGPLIELTAAAKDLQARLADVIGTATGLPVEVDFQAGLAKPEAVKLQVVKL